MVSMIPLRPGNGELERLAELGEWVAPTLDLVEESLDEALSLGNGVVQVDTWDLERLAACRSCSAQRIERLRRMNLRGYLEPRVQCPECRSGAVDRV
jgi:hypothetical protein